MKPEALKIAKRVMKSVLSHPISETFCTLDYLEGYDVQNPLTLKDIENNINSGKYHSLSVWKDDMYLCFKNFKIAWKDGIMLDVVEECEAIFENACQKFETLETSDWMEKVLKLRDKIGQLNASIPNHGVFNMGVHWNQSMRAQLPKVDDWQELVKAVKKLNTEDQLALRNLLREKGTGIVFGEGDAKIDIKELSPPTFWAVWDFVKSTTKKKE